MKKDIMALLQAAEGTYRLNNIAYLKRWTKGGLGDDTDGLTLCFDNLNGVCFSSWVFIKARDYEGIIAESEKAINEYLAAVAERLTKELKAGYRNATH